MISPCYIFSITLSKRLRYVLDILFKQLWGWDYRLLPASLLSIQKEQLKNQVVILYGFQEENFFSIPHSAFIEEGYLKDKWPKPKAIYLFYYQQSPYSLKWDVFSAVFYLLSNYEYFLKETSFHKRLLSEAKIAFLRLRLDKFKEPLVERYLEHLHAALQRHYGLVLPPLRFKQRPVRIVWSADIDRLGFFRYRPWYRQMLSLGASLFRGGLRWRLQCLLGADDPLEKGLQTITRHCSLVFILLNNEHRLDSPTPWKHRRWHYWLKKWQDKTIGIHVGIKAAQDATLLQKTFERYKRLCGTYPKHSRQHYLYRPSLALYRRLAQLGIRYEYTTVPLRWFGFLHGIAEPFPFYDIEQERLLPIKLIPTFSMDTILLHNPELLKIWDAEDTITLFKRFLAYLEAQRAQGTLLFHPEYWYERDLAEILS